MIACCPLVPVSSPFVSLNSEKAAVADLTGCNDRLRVDPREAARLQALYALEILDTPPEPEFDDLIQLAAAICGSPISMLSFVDEERQWFKAAMGLNRTETPRDVAFCHHAIQQPELMMVEDATQDPRFHANPMVTGEAGWRFYAGVPLEGPRGEAVGTLCVIDRQPRSLTGDQRNALRILAGQVNARLELRAQRRALEQALNAAETARIRAEALEQRFTTFMDCGPFIAFIKDDDGRLLYYNEPMAQKFSATRESMLNRTDAELWPPELAAAFRQHDLEVLHTGELQIRHESTRGSDGAATVWKSYKFPITDAAGHQLLGGISVEVTADLRREAEIQRYQAELEAANLRLSELALVDSLTGLANRRVFDQQVRLAFRQARKDGAPLSILMLDVDHFKRHNDQFGHMHGDEVLRMLGACLRQEIRAGDLIARYGGEEFVLLLPDTTGTEASGIAGRLLEAVRQTPWPLAQVTVSIGLSTLNPATRDAQHLISRADEALYAAKCTGRDRFISYADELSHCAIALRNSQITKSRKETNA